MKYLAVAIFFFLNIGFATAQSMKPIVEYMNDGNADNARVSYVMSRCAAILLDFSAILDDQNPRLAEEYRNLSVEASMRFIGFSERAIKETNPSYVAPPNQGQKAMATIQGIGKEYMRLMSDGYQKTGSYLSNPLVKSDLEICGSLLKGK